MIESNINPQNSLWNYFPLAILNQIRKEELECPFLWELMPFRIHSYIRNAGVHLQAVLKLVPGQTKQNDI